MTSDEKQLAISLRGASQNNLRHLDLDFVRGQFTTVTGPSGSGKSSLVIDTLFAEGQRRYIETFSPYARQFIDRMPAPKVEKLTGRREDAQEWLGELEEAFPGYDIHMDPLSLSVACHIGPGALAVTLTKAIHI